ncbi:MAG: ATP synthase subunit b [Gemmatimonadaceae bacterium]|nr:ATP synthase subunit b [Gemmatimonadaceae bacterium]
MRFLFVNTLLLALSTPAYAAEENAKVDLLSPAGGVMFWTLVIFILLLVVLSRYAFKPMLAAVEAREAALQDAIDRAARDRDEAARVLAEHKAQLDAARGEAQQLIADGRAAAEKVRNEMLDVTRAQQAELLERAKRDIEHEKVRAIAALRREAVDLAIAGASKVIDRNLDDAANRALVESFLSTLPADGASR